MASDLAVVAAGIGAGALTSIIGLATDWTRRKGDTRIRAEARSDARESAKRSLLVDVIAAAAARREVNSANSDGREVIRASAKLRTTMVLLAIEGEPEGAQHALRYLRDSEAGNLDQWLIDLIAAVAPTELSTRR